MQENVCSGTIHTLAPCKTCVTQHSFGNVFPPIRVKIPVNFVIPLTAQVIFPPLNEAVSVHIFKPVLKRGNESQCEATWFEIIGELWCYHARRISCCTLKKRAQLSNGACSILAGIYCLRNSITLLFPFAFDEQWLRCN